MIVTVKVVIHIQVLLNFVGSGIILRGLKLHIKVK